MEFVFGTAGEVEVLKTKGREHTDLSGFQQVSRVNGDQTIIDSFRAVKKTHSAEDTAGNCYDWYEIDRHYRFMDNAAVTATAKSSSEASSIAFVLLAEAGTIDAVTAGEHADLFEEWAAPIAYTKGRIRRYDDKLYRCLKNHTSHEEEPPDASVALWACISDQKEPWHEWAPPVGSSDAYAKGDMVNHGGAHWVSAMDDNVFEPGVYGWDKEVSA